MAKEAPPQEAAIAKAARAEIKRRKEQEKLKKKCEADLVEFIRAFWHVLEPSKPLVEGFVLYAICDYLMAAADGHIKRGILNVFPGSAKSLTMNVFFCAWLWGPRNRPAERFLCASYNEGLPERDNIKFLRLVKDPLYKQFWGERFRLIKESVSWIENDQTGWERTTSTHSGTTGHRGTFVLVDDGNDPNNVESTTVRESTIHWVREVMPDRLDNMETGVIINLQQRVHEWDCTGILVKYGTGYAENWLMIPMRFDPLRSTPIIMRRDEDGNPTEIWVDPRGVDENGDELEGIFTDTDGKRKIRPGSPMAKAEGALAWVERFSEEAVNALERVKGPVAFAGQYQQSPTPRGGGIIKDDWWLPWPEKTFPDMGTVILSLNTAVEEDEENENHAATIWGAFSGTEGQPQLMLKAAWKDRAPLAQLVARVTELCEQHKVDYLLIIHKKKGQEVHDEMRRLYQNDKWAIVLVPVEGSEYARLQSVSVLFSGDVKKIPALTPHGQPQQYVDSWKGGMIYAPNTDWADEVIAQTGSFPRGAHAEFVPTVSMALEWCRKNGVVMRKVEYDTQEDEKLKFKPSRGVPYVI